MKKSTLIIALFLCGTFVFTSCSKEETTKPTTTTPVTNTPATMPSMTGTWKSSGTNLPPEDQSYYSEFIIVMNADSSCTWTKVHKSNPSSSLKMEGKVALEASGVKDAAGKPIDRIWFSFTKINGQNMSGSAHGIYQVNGTMLTIDWEFMRAGAGYPDATKGFGSGESGQASVGKYTKQ